MEGRKGVGDMAQRGGGQGVCDGNGNPWEDIRIPQGRYTTTLARGKLSNNKVTVVRYVGEVNPV